MKIFRNVRSTSLKDYLRSEQIHDGDTLKVIKTESGLVALQCKRTKEIYMVHMPDERKKETN